LPGSVSEPPAIDGFSASCSGLMFSDGTTALPRPSPRPWPANTHLFAAASKRLAKISGPKNAVDSSYQVAQGTVRSGPAKSIEGASAPLVWSKFSEPENLGSALATPPTVPAPRVVQLPSENERTKICGLNSLVFCWKIAHGTAGLLDESEPPTTSEFAGSLSPTANS